MLSCMMVAVALRSNRAPTPLHGGCGGACQPGPVGATANRLRARRVVRAAGRGAGRDGPGGPRRRQPQFGAPSTPSVTPSPCTPTQSILLDDAVIGFSYRVSPIQFSLPTSSLLLFWGSPQHQKIANFSEKVGTR